MFNNIGGKIKGLARFIFVLCLIIYVLAAIAGGIMVGIGIGRSNEILGIVLGFGAFVLGAAIGFLIAWIGSFFLFGLGQLIEDTEINRKTNQEILRKLQTMELPASKQ